MAALQARLGAVEDRANLETRLIADGVSQLPPVVVLMDLHMPVLDGVQATQLIKHQWPTMMVIVLTMYATERAAALAAGADAVLIKGSTPDRLRSALGSGVVRDHS